MKIYLESSIHRYLEKVEELLLEHEANNSLMLGLLDRGKNNVGVFVDGIHLGIVEEGGKAVYAFMQTPPNKWILPTVNNLDETIIRSITDFLFQHKYPVPGAIGQVEVAEVFLSYWKEKTNKTASLHMKQLIYQLDEVKVEPVKNGQLIQADQTHQSIVRDWLIYFGEQANLPMTKTQAESMATSYIQRKSLYLWEQNGVLVSMANNSRKTRNGATVNAVFTPDEYKRNGYATSVVAALSQKLLDDGAKFCTLYTDLANPTSNSIYKKIGYYVVGDSVDYRLD
ncbi:GNAT family N-acetyltransferase [Ornithinibacillus halotolerans]|uniref:Acetyltransferase n=1 Tax=Ornithinibacillus halotolerans TaxID=1274357 RepID=A0A916RPE5_9BACI|nr:GNAT family N-acetyltransferase [Ornithinibacillus halotolerans]GGA63671.1 acetyltransferase [Ornithinibacillus halotolerans]